MTAIDDAILEADASWNSGILGQCFMNLLKADPALTLADMEQRLRALGSKTFLVAKPVPAPWGTRALLANGQPASHWLWICLHGKGEMRDELAKLGENVETNLKALETTGFLIFLEVMQ